MNTNIFFLYIEKTAKKNLRKVQKHILALSNTTPLFYLKVFNSKDLLQLFAIDMALCCLKFPVNYNSQCYNDLMPRKLRVCFSIKEKTYVLRFFLFSIFVILQKKIFSILQKKQYKSVKISNFLKIQFIKFKNKKE